jgi:cytoskeletal protein CcmA (bactofilin family)
MWNKRKDEETTPRPQQTAHTSGVPGTVSQARETQPTMSGSLPMRNADMPGHGGSATIGKAVMVKGQIFSREDLVIDGEVEGTVEAHDHRVTVGPNGKVHAGVKAREIVVLGAIQGNVEAADKIDIRKDARLLGDIKTSRIVIEDGAYFKGSIDIIKDKEGAKQQQQQARPQQAQPVSANAASPAAPAPVAASSN